MLSSNMSEPNTHYFRLYTLTYLEKWISKIQEIYTRKGTRLSIDFLVNMQMSEYTRNRDMCKLNTFHPPHFSLILLTILFSTHYILYARNTNSRFMLIIWVVLMFHVVFITQQQVMLLLSANIQGFLFCYSIA